MANATPRTLQPPRNRSDIDCRGSKIGVVGALLGVRKFLPPPTFSFLHSCPYIDHAMVGQLAALVHLSTGPAEIPDELTTQL